MEHARARCPIADPKQPEYRDPDIEDLRTALIYIDCVPRAFRIDFREWLQNNFPVYRAFDREANLVWSRGRRHYSQRTIWEYLRHESAVRDDSSQFKLNDWYLKDIARLYIMMHPGTDGFFEFRNGQSAVRTL